MYLYWKETVTENYHGTKHSLYVADVSFRDFIISFRNVGGAQAVVAYVKFQEELFRLEQSGRPLPNHTRRFKTPPTARCNYSNKKLRFTIMKTEKQKLLVSTMLF